MNYNINKRLKQIETENKIWILYLLIIVFSLYANHLEKDYFYTGFGILLDGQQYLWQANKHRRGTVNSIRPHAPEL